MNGRKDGRAADLQSIRDHIDHIDRQVLDLLAKRMRLALRAGKLKTVVRDEAREARVLAQAARFSLAHRNLIRARFVRSLFGDIIKESRRIQERRRGGRKAPQGDIE